MRRHGELELREAPAGPRRYDRTSCAGWGKRRLNWSSPGGIQHELIPGLGIDFAYFRRIEGKPADHVRPKPDAGPITTNSASPRRRIRVWPGGGGYVISDLYNLKPAKFGLPDRRVLPRRRKTSAKNIRHWKRIRPETPNARAVKGILLRGGNEHRTFQHRQLRHRGEAEQPEHALLPLETTSS
jgi:hypothetical protein